MRESSAPITPLPSSGDPELWGRAVTLAAEARELLGEAVARLYKAADIYAGNGLEVPQEITNFKNAVEDCLPFWSRSR